MPPQSVVEINPESVARESLVLPLAQLADGTVVLAAPEPPGRLVEWLEFILNCRVAFVGVIDQDLTFCLDRNYGHSETESVDSVHYLWLPGDGLRGGPLELATDPVVAFWNQIILDAVVYIASALQVEIDGALLDVWHCFPNGVRRRHEYPITAQVLARLVPVLRSFLRNPTSDPPGTN